MDEKEAKNHIPCIVENGILYNPKDIQKVLRDLGQVNYFQIVEGVVKASGEGYVVSVVANNSSANIIVNKRLYLNVNGFEYMVLKTENQETILELVEQFCILRLIPVPIPVGEEQIPSDMLLASATDFSDEEYDEELAEINIDDDFDEE